MGWSQQAETAANLSDFLLVIRRGWAGHVSGATLVVPYMKDVDHSIILDWRRRSYLVYDHSSLF